MCGSMISSRSNHAPDSALRFASLPLLAVYRELHPH